MARLKSFQKRRTIKLRGQELQVEWPPTKDYPLTVRTDGRFCWKHRDTGYQYVRDVSGKPVRWPEWREALDRYNRQLAGLADEPPKIESVADRGEAATEFVTVKQAVDQYVREKEASQQRKKLSAASVKCVKQMRGFLLEAIDGKRRLGSLKPRDFKRMVTVADEKGWSEAYRHKICKRYLLPFLRWCAKDELVDKMPNVGTTFDDIETPEARDKVITLKQVKQLLAEADPVMAAWIWLGINGGCDPAAIGMLQSEGTATPRDFTKSNPGCVLVRDGDGQLWVRGCRSKKGTGPFKFKVWKETEKAIAAAIEYQEPNYARAASREAERMVFRMQRTGCSIKKPTDNPVSGNFKDFARDVLGRKVYDEKVRGFGAFRKLLQTTAENYEGGIGELIVDSICGHKPQAVGGKFYRMSADRLLSDELVGNLCDWLREQLT